MTIAGDNALMREVQRGDKDAFAALVDRHKVRLVNYLTAMTHDRDRAEELAQDAFVRLYEHAGSYEERGRFLPYLFRIATNLLRSEERTRRRREALLSRFSGNGRSSGNGAGNGACPQARLLRDEAGAQVGAALRKLPLRYRSPLLLREMEGWSYQDIASALDCREGTVKSRVHRGRERLRALLAPYWNGDSE